MSDHAMLVVIKIGVAAMAGVAIAGLATAGSVYEVGMLLLVAGAALWGSWRMRGIR